MKPTIIYEKIKNVQTTIPFKEKEALRKAATKVPDGGIIVDIGTCAGGSAFLMALASKPSVHVWTIDPIENKAFLEKRMEFGLIDKVHFINQTSDNAVKDWNEPIDLLFIDGEHAGAYITRDIDNWGKFVKKGSTIILHDYIWYGDVVQKAMDAAEIKLKLIDVPFGHYNEKPVGIAVTEKL